MKRLIAIAVLACTSAHAEFKDGNKLLADMNGSSMNQMNALGYVTGVADTVMSITSCPPTTVTAGQIYDMAKQYLENNPAVRHQTADVIIGRMLRIVWPCSRGQNL